MTLNTKSLVLIFLVIVIVLLIIVFFGKYSLRKDSSKIHTDLIKKTPTNMTLDDVSKIITSMGLQPEISRNAGFLKQENGGSEIIGRKSIRVHLGDYLAFPFFTTSVTAFWGFDENEKLIEIWIWKTTDGL